MNQPDTTFHVKGASPFIDDLPTPSGTCFGALVTSTIPHGTLHCIQKEAALAVPGVAAIYDASDIPGENQIGNIIQDEPLLAADTVHYRGQPAALVVATRKEAAEQAAKQVTLDTSSLPANFAPRIAAREGALIQPPRTVSMGNTALGFAQSHVVVSGQATTGAQEHLYLETQSALAVPGMRGEMKIFCASQSPSAVQRNTARILGLPMNAVSVETPRLGGGFGGKEDRATPVAALCALAAHHLGRPVKTILPRSVDMRTTGKRHPYEYDYKLGLSKTGEILAFEATYYQNSGASADLSPAVMERTLLHCTGAYRIPNVRVTGYCCRTHLPPFTAFRGFGAPQAFFCIETAIDHGAKALDMPRWQIQANNLLKSGDTLPFGMTVEQAHGHRAFESAVNRYDFKTRTTQIAKYNQNHRFEKKGISIMPLCFGIAFTSTFLNQAGALVHVYTDGTVAIHTGAVEMGQGVNSKLIAVASDTLGIFADRCIVNHTRTDAVANTSPTAASTGADLNGGAVQLACRALKERLLCVAADRLHCNNTDLNIAEEEVTSKVDPTIRLSWNDLVQAAYMARVNLSSQAHYATPKIHYDKTKEQGRPFSYHVFGAALTEVTVDVLRGTCKVEKVQIVHDAGRSLNPSIDRGQVEGALMQGIGWVTGEEILYKEGRLLSDTLSSYKVPDLYDAPSIQLTFLDNADHDAGLMKSKAVGEPPFVYGIGAYFALLDAVRAEQSTRPVPYDAPMTPERLLTALLKESDKGDAP